MVGSKLVYLMNYQDLIVAEDYGPVNLHDTAFQTPIDNFHDAMVLLTNTGFQAKAGDPPKTKLCKGDTWNMHMLIETVLPILTTIYYFKQNNHRT